MPPGCSCPHGAPWHAWALGSVPHTSTIDAAEINLNCHKTTMFVLTWPSETLNLVFRHHRSPASGLMWVLWLANILKLFAVWLAFLLYRKYHDAVGSHPLSRRGLSYRRNIQNATNPHRLASTRPLLSANQSSPQVSPSSSRRGIESMITILNSVQDFRCCWISVTARTTQTLGPLFFCLVYFPVMQYGKPLCESNCLCELK